MPIQPNTHVIIIATSTYQHVYGRRSDVITKAINNRETVVARVRVAITTRRERHKKSTITSAKSRVNRPSPSRRRRAVGSS